MFKLKIWWSIKYGYWIPGLWLDWTPNHPCPPCTVRPEHQHVFRGEKLNSERFCQENCWKIRWVQTADLCSCSGVPSHLPNDGRPALRLRVCCESRVTLVLRHTSILSFSCFLSMEPCNSQWEGSDWHLANYDANFWLIKTMFINAMALKQNWWISLMGRLPVWPPMDNVVWCKLCFSSVY